jgi:hypothetical protein
MIGIRQIDIEHLHDRADRAPVLMQSNRKTAREVKAVSPAKSE